MAGDQLPLFQRKTYKRIISSLPIAIEAPAGDMTVLHVLPAYYTNLKGGDFSKYTPDDFTEGVKKFGIFLNDRAIKDIARRDIQAWISHLKSPVPKGEGLSAKTVSRKLTALSNFFSWLVAAEVIGQQANPMLDIANTRISSPLPEILFEEECTRLLIAASDRAAHRRLARPAHAPRPHLGDEWRELSAPAEQAAAAYRDR
jgi:site-specific recombinase XerC